MTELQEFKLFLETAPLHWNIKQQLNKFQLPNGEFVSCVLWNELFHISGTDIVKCLIHRFNLIGRTVKLQKKFEEGVFSDLRNLKPLQDSSLEESRSPFLNFLHENNCIRTQKKQKVFYWFSVRHDKLFLDALDRDLKREASGQLACTIPKENISSLESTELAKNQCLPPAVAEKSFVFDGIINSSSQPQVIKSLPSLRYIASPALHEMSASPAQSNLTHSPSQSQLLLNPLMSNQPYQYTQSQFNYQPQNFDAGGRHESAHGHRLEHRSSPYPGIDRQYPCDYCGKIFKRLEHLQRHVRLHTNEKSYVCQFIDCGQAFQRSEHLSQHMLEHGDRWDDRWNEISYHDQSFQNTESAVKRDDNGMRVLSDYEINSQSRFEDTRPFNSMQYKLPYQGYKGQTLQHHYSDAQSGDQLNEQLDNLMDDILSLDPDLKEFPNQRLLSY